MWRLLDVPGGAVQVVQRRREAVFGRRDECDVPECGSGLEMVAGLAGCLQGEVVVRPGGHRVLQVEERETAGQRCDPGPVDEQAGSLGRRRPLT